MGQTFTDDCFAGTHVAQTDMGNIETNFATLKSNFSGSSAPSNPVPGQIYFDTTQKLLHFRNQADDDWLGLIPGDTDQKLWIYRNDTVDGMAVDSSVTDRVLAIKGGSNAYNVNGGNTAGTWTPVAHTLAISEIPSHDHGGVTGSGGHVHTGSNFGGPNPESTAPQGTTEHTHTISSQGGGGSHSHGDGSARIAAAVGTLQYPDVA